MSSTLSARLYICGEYGEKRRGKENDRAKESREGMMEGGVTREGKVEGY